MHKLLKTVLVATLMVLFAASMASAAGWTETWESYTSLVTPYDGWVLNTGTWMPLGTPNHTPGGSKSYKIVAPPPPPPAHVKDRQEPRVHRERAGCHQPGRLVLRFQHRHREADLWGHPE